MRAPGTGSKSRILSACLAYSSGQLRDRLEGSYGGQVDEEMAAAVDGLFAELLGLHDAIRLAGDSFVRTAGLEHAYPDLLLAPDNQSAAVSHSFARTLSQIAALPEATGA